MNHYEVLGVGVGAPPEEIRRAYLGAARRHHPDFHVGADEATRADHARRMQAVNQAWTVLGDAEARARYDRTLDDGDPARQRTRPGAGPRVPPGKGWTPRPGDDAWQDDFRAWAEEDERLGPDPSPPPRQRGVLAVAPVALFALGVAALVLGAVLGGRGLLALGFGSLVISAALFVVLPIYEMSRGRRRG